MHSISNLILQLRTFARTSLGQNQIINDVPDIPTTSRCFSVPSTLPQPDFDQTRQRENESYNTSHNQFIRCCPRCDFDFSRRNVKTSSIDEDDGWYCPQRRQGRLPSTTASSRRQTDTAREYISRRSMELLGLLTYLKGNEKNDNPPPPSATPTNDDNNSWMKMLGNLRGTPRFGIFVEVTPDDAASPVPSYLDMLFKLVRQLPNLGKGNASRQTDQETQINPRQDYMDSAVQCDSGLLRSTTESFLSVRIRKKFNDTSTSVTASKSQDREVRQLSVLPSTPFVDISDTKVFNSGDDVCREIQKKWSTIEESSVESRNTSRTSSGRLYTVEEMPSTIVLRPRCKDVLSLPTQPAVDKPSQGRIRCRRSFIQTDYVTKTVLSVLHDSRTPVNPMSLMNAVSFHSESSKRSLGKFLLNERLKRILSEIVTSGPRSPSMSCAKFCQHSTMSVRVKKNNPRRSPHPWEQQVAIYGTELATTSIPEIYLKKSIPSDDDDDTSTDVTIEDDVDLVREIFLRSCSFSQSAANESNRNSSTDKTNNVSGESSHCRDFLPKESCSFAQSSSVVTGRKRRQVQTAKMSTNHQTDFVTGYVHVEQVFLDKGIQVDFDLFSTPESTFIKDGEEMTGLVNWKPSLASNIFFKHLSFLSSG